MSCYSFCCLSFNSASVTFQFIVSFKLVLTANNWCLLLRSQPRSLSADRGFINLSALNISTVVHTLQIYAFYRAANNPPVFTIFFLVESAH